MFNTSAQEFGLHVGRAEAKELGRSTTRGIYAGALRNGPAVASVPVGAIAVGTLNLDVRQIGGGGGKQKTSNELHS